MKCLPMDDFFDTIMKLKLAKAELHVVFQHFMNIPLSHCLYFRLQTKIGHETTIHILQVCELIQFRVHIDLTSLSMPFFTLV